MNETYVTIRGRLVADPTVRTTRTGAPMTTFRIASSVRRPVQGQPGVWEDAETSFYDVVTYRALAANAGVSLRKGHPVIVHGRQHVSAWQTDDGTTWWAVEVVADAVGHDLSYGTTAFARVGRGQRRATGRARAATVGGPGCGGGAIVRRETVRSSRRPETRPLRRRGARPGAGSARSRRRRARAEPPDTGPLVPHGRRGRRLSRGPSGFGPGRVGR